MTPVNFPQANRVFTKPEGWTDEQCGDLHVWAGEVEGVGPVNISAWQPSEKDIEAINAGKPVFLSVCGQGLPPVSVFTENPFNT